MRSKSQYNPNGSWGDSTQGDARGTGSPLLPSSPTLGANPQHPILNYLTSPVKNRFQGVPSKKGFVKQVKGPAAVGQLSPVKPGSA